MNEEPNKLEENWRNPDGTLKPGHPNLGAGRPKGKTLKEWARDKLMKMTEEEREDFIKTLPKDIVWRMAEGNPQTNTDITSDGKPIPIFGNVPENHSDSQDTETPEET